MEGDKTGSVVLPKSHLAKGTDPKVFPQNVLPNLYWGLLHGIGLVQRPLIVDRRIHLEGRLQQPTFFFVGE
jgi:hypothetical protein